jgi:transcriptional regulator with XRE-family HTH domain
MKEFSPAKRHIEVSVGESVRILRELQELSQNELADISGRVSLGVERAKTLARALKCHPAVLLFPGWNVEVESAA